MILMSQKLVIAFKIYVNILWIMMLLFVMGDQYGAYAASLIQYNENIYIFDPHSISHVTGMPCCRWKICSTYIQQYI